MDFFKMGVKFGIAGAFVGMFMGAIIMLLSLLFTGTLFNHNYDPENFQGFSVFAMCAGSFLGAFLGGLSGVLSRLKK